MANNEDNTDDFNYKLKQITDVWNHFILEHKSIAIIFKFNDDVKTNYFGDILGYFNDVVGIIFAKPSKFKDYTQKFSYSISLLQALYVQQDFVEEMLLLFKTGITKGKLKEDPLYSINREIRNEIVGHPIRKTGGRLISSTLFSYDSKYDEIEYLRYHIDNDFKFETIQHKFIDIQKRHQEFLIKYFDIVLYRLSIAINKYLRNLENVILQSKLQEFTTVLKIVDVYFESIYGSDFLYDKISLLRIYSKRHKHIRYQNLIDRFNRDLEQSLIEKKEYAKTIFQRDPFPKSDSKLPKIKIKFVHRQADSDEIHINPKITYNYEIGKIATKRNPQDFSIYGKWLKDKCKDNVIVLAELKHMEENIFDEIEYYCALRLICTELREG